MSLENFSNEIADIPEKPRRRKFFETPEEIKVELEKSKNAKEGEFRKWLIKNKPATAVMTPIETSTATGVPDIFACYNGFSSWIECKVLANGHPRFRGTQYTYIKKLINAGGNAKIVMQKINPRNYKPTSIYIFEARNVVSIPFDMFKPSGQDLIFPPDLKPWYIWHYAKKGKSDIDELYERLLLDSNDFAW